ncbi:MAG TPA: TerC/Alx family metal homeostasis membrane protein [Sphingobacterium sp.]|nr:TerC/Alx family metal homeostasis membrane protein [Sphingobacterium sp.]
MISHEVIFFTGFLLFIGFMLAIDLGVFTKKNTEVSLKAAAFMSSLWVLLSLLFSVLLYYWGHELHDIQSIQELQDIVLKHKHSVNIIPDSFDVSLANYRKNLALEYLTGYVVEYALSVDNILVIVILFSSFGIPEKYYHKVLVWGILGALILRFIFIFIGAALIAKFGWILYVFGVFLIYTGIKIYLERNKKEEVNPKDHPVVKFASKYFNVSESLQGGKFFFKQNGRLFITPLFLVLMAIEFTDLIFATDSIPAIFSVTRDPYIVFFSNIFAILGLRSMFFLLVNVLDKFKYLETGLAFLMVFIGAKMLLHDWLEIIGFTTTHSLLIIIGILAISVVASLIASKKTAT